MTVAATPRKAGPYAGNDVTTLFPFSFKVFAADDVQVVYTDTATGTATTLVLNSDYSVLLNADQDASPGGTITYPLVGSPLTVGDTLTAIGDLPYAQPTDITNTGRFLPQVIENSLDRATIQIQQLAEVSSRTLQAAVGTTVDLIFPPPSSGKFIRWRTDLLGLENADAGTDSMVLQGLLADAVDPAHGSFMLGHSADGAGAVPLTVQVKLREVVSVKDFGAVGDSNGTTGNGTDDTVAFQAAIDYVKQSGGRFSVFVPAGVYRLTSQLAINSAVAIVGVGASPYVGSPTGAIGGGSWLYFDHTGKGLLIDAAASLSGVLVEKIGTRRNQPAPAPAWTPNAHDYDIYVDDADVLIRDVMLLNPTKGVFLTNGSYGRLEIDTLRGQAFQTLIRVGKTFDVVKINNLHQWPFWRDDANVHAYTMANCDAIRLERADNPMLTNIFTIFARSGLRVGQNADGTTSKLHLVNADFDRGAYGLWVDSSVTSGMTGQMTNVSHQGETGLAVPASLGVFIEGNNSRIDFGSFDCAYAWRNAVRVEGTGNRVAFGWAKANFYDQGAGNFPAFEAYAGNYLIFATQPSIQNSGLGGRYAPTGTISVDEWRVFNPIVTTQSGTITTHAATGLFKVVGGTVSVQFEINVVDNGTGAGDVRFLLPFGSSAIASTVGSGRERALTGNQLQASVTFGTGHVVINKYDNTYPALSGAVLIGNMDYRIAFDPA